MTHVPPRARPLRMYGSVSDLPPLEWSWVDQCLAAAGTYWVVAAVPPAHPRPVWGVWLDQQLLLSIGSPAIARALVETSHVVVHLDSGTEPVILEGVVVGASTDAEAIAAYDAKYQWQYDFAEYGALTLIAPRQIIAWRSAGWAGREGFRQVGRWEFAP